MALAEARNPEVVRREIALERQRLAEAVTDLRETFAEMTDIRSRLGSRLALLAPAAFVGGFVLAGGIGATMRYFARRGRDR
jgi:hypothetical protein